MARRLTREIKKIDEAERRRALGRWWGFNVSGSQDLKNPSDTVGSIHLPEPGDTANETLHIYGMDSVVVLQVVGGNATQQGTVNGALGFAHQRKGQALPDTNAANSDFPVPFATGNSFQTGQAFRAWLPVVMSITAGQTQNVISFPYRFFTKRSIQIRPGERFSIVYGSYSGWASPDLIFRITWFGRYRYYTDSTLTV